MNNNRLKIAMLQRKYMAKKRSLGELPKTKNQIIEELQNNWNKLKKWLEEIINDIKNLEEQDSYDIYEKTTLKNILNKMQELEQGKDE